MADEVVVLNVGGSIYHTTRSTLGKYPDSMLGAMFNGQYSPSSYDSQGNYFIDRDGEMFKYILNFLRSGRISLPQGFKDFDLLEVEADFFQIPPLILALRAMQPSNKQSGHYIEILDFEETAYFYRFYSDPPKGIPADVKHGGIVISGPKAALEMLPLPDKSMKELETSDAPYRTINITNNSSPPSSAKMSIVHYLQNSGWKLLNTGFANSSDTDGSYMVHKYMWFLAT